MQTTTFTYLVFLGSVVLLHWSLRGTRPRNVLLLADDVARSIRIPATGAAAP